VSHTQQAYQFTKTWLKQPDCFNSGCLSEVVIICFPLISIKKDNYQVINS